MNNLFTLSKKQQKCYVNEENKDFSVDGSECICRFSVTCIKIKIEV